MFQTLSASRPIGMGSVGAIPISEMAVYFNLFGIHDFDERAECIKMIQALDSVYLKHVHKPKAKEENGTIKQKGRRSPKKPPRRRG